ncbi:MAG: amidohydrolase [Alphaproteobacteria bacterium]|nr:MAG: amidohydrolase [Alphaproteobacteria bacterium]
MARRDDWLDQVHEPILEPEREIVDPHHHLWERPEGSYLLEDLWADTGSGHKVVQTVFIECRAWWRQDGDPELAPVGETERVAAIAREAARRPERAQIAGIIAWADLRRPPEALERLLDAHAEAAGGLLRGIRQAGAHDPEPEALTIPGREGPGLYADPDFRRGLAHLGARGLTYETWHYHHQMGDFLDLVRAVPETRIILDHCGTPLGVGRFAGRRAEIYDQWRRDIEALAACPNLFVKLGGMAMPDNGWGWHERPRPPTSEEFAAAYAPWYRHVIDCFGPERCMFESNFPVDRVSVGYQVLWNAFKRIAAELEPEAKRALFAGTARRVYGLPEPGPA